jgi:hypothetical protein
MGWAEVIDQGLAGFMVQLLKGGSADLDRQAVGLGVKLAGPFRQNLEHNFTHQRYLCCFSSFLIRCRAASGAVGYGEPHRRTRAEVVAAAAHQLLCSSVSHHAQRRQGGHEADQPAPSRLRIDQHLHVICATGANPKAW